MIFACVNDEFLLEAKSTIIFLCIFLMQLCLCDVSWKWTCGGLKHAKPVSNPSTSKPKVMICVQSMILWRARKFVVIFSGSPELPLQLHSHLPFFKCSIAARKMWRCQLQTKVSCGSLWTRDATWYLWPPIARNWSLQGRWNFFHVKGHEVRTLGFKFGPDRTTGSAWKWPLYSAGEFNKVGSFRRCSRKKAELLLWRRCVPLCVAHSAAAGLTVGGFRTKPHMAILGNWTLNYYKPKRWLTRK